MQYKTTNVDSQELDKFTQLAHTWWDPNGPLKSLHDINPLRFAWIGAQAQLKHKNILDVGCGGGILTESLAKAGANTMGIDLAYDCIEVAKMHAQNNQLKIDYQIFDVEQLAQKKTNSFDVITCMELLEHVPDPARTIHACSQLLKLDGVLFTSTINKNIKAYLQAIIIAEYILGIVPKKTHEYSKFITPASLAHMARKHQLELMGISGFSYSPMSQQYFLTSNVDVNYMAVFKKLAK